MRFYTKDILSTTVVLLSAVLLTFDLFFFHAQPSTFDGPMHITMTAQFFHALSQGEFRVTWADGFGNYGMPIPLIHQQVAAYLGAMINFVLQNVVLSTSVVYFFGAFLSAFFLYIFLRVYFLPEASLAGTFLFNFTSYRIIDLYIRGALPEFFASVFIPLILLGMYLLIHEKKVLGFVLLAVSCALLTLTHPFVLVIGLFLFIPYGIYLLLQTTEKIKSFVLLVVAAGIGVGMTTYYILPLNVEIKYFYYGLSANHFVPNQSMGLANYISPNWYYFYIDSFLVRGNFIQFGFLETLLLCIGLITVIFFVRRKQLFLLPWMIAAVTYIFLTTKYSIFLYTHINFLSNIQHQWRMFAGLMFIPPVILAYLINKTKYAFLLLCLTILVVSFVRFSQIYGKNFVDYPQSTYFFTTKNLAAVVLNPIWTGESQTYPVEPSKVGILKGSGVITDKILLNSFRSYHIDAKTVVRMADYTFYFPGWHVYVDGREVPIQFQDPQYRGVITYMVPAGEHSVLLQFENTKIRTIGIIVSCICIVVFCSIAIGLKRLKLLA